jgi:Rap1a immunity proteins
VRYRALAFGFVLIAAGASSASAAVSESQFPPHTVADLIAICAPKDDPLMTGAVNFCHGYAEGAVVVEEAHEAQRGGRKLFCLPTPRPPRDPELASFITWANEVPARLDMPAIDGMFIYLAGKYPFSCQETEIAMKRLILAAVVASVPLTACSDMTPGQQRALSGTAIGAGGGGRYWRDRRQCGSRRRHWCGGGSRRRPDLQSG